MTREKLTLWSGHCSRHGKVYVHQDSPPKTCHHRVRLSQTCGRHLTKILQIKEPTRPR